MRLGGRLLYFTEVEGVGRFQSIDFDQQINTDCSKTDELGSGQKNHVTLTTAHEKSKQIVITAT